MTHKRFLKVLTFLVLLTLISLPINVINHSVAFAIGTVLVSDDFDHCGQKTGALHSKWGNFIFDLINTVPYLVRSVDNFDCRSEVKFEANPNLSVPLIEIWYGNEQYFGQLGNAQKWINILGNVTDSDGIASLTYSLNNGINQPLSIGPDNRRLLSTGDFNVEIDRANLLVGSNKVSITAVDYLSNAKTQIVTVNYAENTWPLPYSIDWSSVTDIQDVVQVVDGIWTIEPSGIHIQDMGYDRVLAIGDVSWTDYEVILPVTVHAIDETSYGSNISISPGIGITLRWQGHTDDPIVCPQIHCGWEPAGGGVWYEWMQTGADNLSIFAKPPSGFARITETLSRHMDSVFNVPSGFVRTTEKQLELGNTYWFKSRVENNGFGTLYSLKIWEDGVEREPADWTLQRKTGIGNLKNGSFLIIAHHVDTTIGDVKVLPLAADKASSSIINLLKENTLSLITWLAVLLIIVFICWLLLRYLTNQHSQKL